MTTLLDGNVLVALVVEDHAHHQAAVDWFSPRKRFATCPITQGTLVRLLVRNGMSGGDAVQVLANITSPKRHEFWPDDIGYDRVNMKAVIGHRQVTDAYLAELARLHDAQLATFDRVLAETYADVAELVPIGD